MPRGQAVQLALEILEHLAKQEVSGVTEIAAALGRTKARVHRRLRTLINTGCAVHAAGGERPSASPCYGVRTMTRSLAALTLVAAVCIAAPAAGSQATNQIEGVVVVAGPGPTVQSSYPSPGGSVPGGVMILKIVFDQPMKPDAWAYSPSAGANFPDCLATPRLLSDQRTFALLCTVAPNRTFALEINPSPRFANAYGHSAKPFTLRFSTTGSRTDDLHDALLQAGLTDTDDPIMTWRDPGQGVSQTAPPP